MAEKRPSQSEDGGRQRNLPILPDRRTKERRKKSALTRTVSGQARKVSNAGRRVMVVVMVVVRMASRRRRRCEEGCGEMKTGPKRRKAEGRLEKKDIRIQPAVPVAPLRTTRSAAGDSPNSRFAPGLNGIQSIQFRCIGRAERRSLQIRRLVMHKPSSNTSPQADEKGKASANWKRPQSRSRASLSLSSCQPFHFRVATWVSKSCDLNQLGLKARRASSYITL